MKSKLTILAVCLLTAALLAGCAADPSAPAAETTQGIVLETQAPVPETTVPVVTEPVVKEAPTEAPFEVTINPVITGEQTQVTVTTADEFLAAIAPDTEIILDATMIDLSTAAGYGETDGEYYQWREEFDGPGLYIVGVSNLTIRGASDDHNATVISCDPRYAHVLSFENCSNIHVKGFTAGHSKEAGACHGGVLAFINSQDVLIEDCGLFGCGTWGVWGENSRDIQVANSEIYECSTCGLYLSSCRDIQVDGTTFRDLGWIWTGTLQEPANEYIPGVAFQLYDCQNITFNGEPAPEFMTLKEMGLE